MKYKNIYSALHNFGDSFFSLMNYFDGIYISDLLTDIRLKGIDIEIDWLSKEFKPPQELTDLIKKSIDYYHSKLKDHLNSQDVEIDYISEIKMFIPSRGRKYMWAKDDRGKEYKIHFSEIH